MSLFVRIFICFVIAGAALYKHIDNSNALTGLRLAIPALQKEVNQIKEDNIVLQYEIDQFENPAHLIELSHKPEFAHLKYPSSNAIIILTETYDH